MTADDVRDRGNTQAIIDTAIQAAEATLIKPEDGTLAIVPVPYGGEVKVLDLAAELAPHQPTPARKTGSFNVLDADSFVAYVDKHGTPDTEVWADVPSARVVGVINAHGYDNQAPGWADHRVTYAAQFTEAWETWSKFDGALLDQVAFAELIEDRAVDIIRPSGAEMLEIAQTFQATVGVQFGSSKLLSSGERQVEYRETVDATAGKAGKLTIPKDFDLALIPFEGAEPYKVTANFRFRINGGDLKVGYRLVRPKDVLREAFLGVVKTIADRVEQPVFNGRSA